MKEIQYNIDLRDVQEESLNDIMFHVLRKVSADNADTIKITNLRRSTDVIYFQHGNLYYTWSLYLSQNKYHIYHRVQGYHGDIRHEDYSTLDHPFKELKMIDFVSLVDYMYREQFGSNKTK